MANLNTNIAVNELGLEVAFFGFTGDLLKFMNDVAIQISTTKKNFDEEKFKNIQQKSLERLSDLEKRQPISIVNMLVGSLITHSPITIYQINDFYENLKKLTFEEFVYNFQNFFKEMRFEWFAIGNLASDEVIKAAKSFEKYFNSTPLSINRITKLQAVELEKGKAIPFFEFHISESQQKNSAATIIFQEKTSNPKNSMLFVLIYLILHEPFFTRLRTTEQLGYIVNVEFKNNHGVYILQFSVQSEIKDPHYLASRIWNFLHDFQKIILNIDEKEIETWKEPIISNLLKKDLNINEEGNLYWSEISAHSYNFKIREKQAKMVKRIKVKEFISFVKELLYNDPKTLEVLVISPNHKEENRKSMVSRVKNGTILKRVESIEEFQKNKQLYEDYYHFENSQKFRKRSERKKRKKN